MVYIIKKKENETIEILLRRVCGIMINMEYNCNVYNDKNIYTNIKKKNKYEKFNVFKYEYFDDEYIFNCGTVIFTDTMINCNKFIKKIQKNMEQMDIFKDDIIYKPCTINNFKTTQYSVIWKQILASDIKRVIRINKKNTCDDNGLAYKFIWSISPISCMSYGNYTNYKYAFRSLSTIIVDTENIIKYTENMIPFNKKLTYSVENNYPLFRQLNVYNKKILSFPVSFDAISGICIDFTNNEKYFYTLSNKIVYSVNYKTFRLLPVIRKYQKRSFVTELKKFIFETNLSKDEIKLQSKPIKIREIKTPYDICWYCYQPLYDDIYVIELPRNNAQIAICKICMHYNGNITIDCTYYNENFTILRSKIPRNIYEAIDLMNRLNKIPCDEFELYKIFLKIIHKKFPKKLNVYDIDDIVDIKINNDIILCNDLSDIWSNLDRIKNIHQKIIIPIRIYRNMIEVN